MPFNQGANAANMWFTHGIWENQRKDATLKCYMGRLQLGAQRFCFKAFEKPRADGKNRVNHSRILALERAKTARSLNRFARRQQGEMAQ